MSSYFIYQSGGFKSSLTYKCTIYALKNKQIIAFNFDLGKRYLCYICLTVKKINKCSITLCFQDSLK